MPHIKDISEGFFIVKESDRADEKHIARRDKDGKFYYVHPFNSHQSEIALDDGSNPTSIRDFGVMLAMKGQVLIGVQISSPKKSSLPVPPPGQWKGSQAFSFKIR